MRVSIGPAIEVMKTVQRMLSLPMPNGFKVDYDYLLRMAKLGSGYGKLFGETPLADWADGLWLKESK